MPGTALPTNSNDPVMDDHALLLRILNEQIAQRRDLAAIMEKLGLLTRQVALERLIEAEREDRALRDRQGVKASEAYLNRTIQRS